MKLVRYRVQNYFPTYNMLQPNKIYVCFTYLQLNTASFIFTLLVENSSLMMWLANMSLSLTVALGRFKVGNHWVMVMVTSSSTIT